jgi:hypothetical protein
MVRSHARALVALATVLSTTACLDTNGPNRQASATSDLVIAVTAAGTVGQLDAVRGAGFPGLGRRGLFPLIGGMPSCEASAGGRPCPPRGDTTGVTRTVTWLDAGGVAEAAYDSLLTATATFVLDVNRSDSLGSRVEHRSMTATGLVGNETERTWNGSATVNDAGAGRFRPLGPGMGPGGMGGGHGRGGLGSGPGGGPFGGTPPAYLALAETTTVTNVVLPQPAAQGSYPKSGTINTNSYIMVVSAAGDTTRESRLVTVTFDGSSTAQITVNGETRAVDLSRRPFRGGPPHGGEGPGHP